MHLIDMIYRLRAAGVRHVRIELELGDILQPSEPAATVPLSPAPRVEPTPDANAQAGSHNEQTAAADEAEADKQARDLELAHI